MGRLPKIDVPTKCNDSFQGSSHQDLDNVNLAGIKSSIRAIILPVSKSAIHSLGLKRNKGTTWSVAISRSLPSPGEDGTENVACNPTQTVILLEESREKERFTLGSSSDNSDFVLEHNDHSQDQDLCYINLEHVQLLPDPDHDAVVFYNGSTLTFTYRSFLKPHIEDTIPPRQEIRISSGSWEFSFGKGLDFQIKIFPQPTAKSTCDSWALISPLPPPLSSLKPDSERNLGKADLRRDLTTPDLKRDLAASDSRRDLTAPDLKRDLEKEIAKPVSVVTHQHELIFKTNRTLVYKRKSQETAIAVKMLRKPRLKDAAQNWRNELNILKRLDHASFQREPSIVRLLKSDASKLSLELEFVGPDLSKVVDEKKISKLSRVAQYNVWEDVCKGLRYIHGQHILHLDIKPQNILLDKDHRAKIADFGFSVEDFVGAGVSRSGGTPNYIPPEYILQDTKRGCPADIWAFGITMLFVLGHIPLPNGTWRIADITRSGTQARQEIRGWFDQVDQLVKGLPENLKPLNKMLAQNPQERITTSQLLTSLSKISQFKAGYGKLLN